MLLLAAGLATVTALVGLLSGGAWAQEVDPSSGGFDSTKPPPGQEVPVT